MAAVTSLAAWTPGLDDEATLGEVYAGMPGDEAASIPWRVRLLENPASPIALPGAVDLFGHDCIHITLGRGTAPRDEAFVLGVTMGSSGTLTPRRQWIYTLAASRWYRGPYRLTGADLVVFATAVEFGRRTGIRPLNIVPWRELVDCPLGEIRARVGIDSRRLAVMYEAERAVWPDDAAAQRLPRLSRQSLTAAPSAFGERPRTG